MRPRLLHGGMFGLGVHRPRLFESNTLVLAPRESAVLEPVGVYGEHPNGRLLWTRKNGNGGKRSEMRCARSVEEARRVMGMEWGTWREVKEAIPPAYTEHIGGFLLAALASSSEAA